MRQLRIALSLAFVALAGCTQAVTPPVSQQPVGSVPDYFWRSFLAGMTLTDTLGSPLNNLTFADTGGLLQINDPKGKPIYCIINSDSVYATNISHGSVIDLDDGSYFSRLDTEMLVPHLMRCDAVNGTNSLLIGTDTGVFEYYQTQARYNFIGLGGKDITLLSIDPNHSNVYAATASDSIFTRQGGNWNPVDLNGLPAGHIIALLADTDQYVAIAGANGIYKRSSSGGAWSKLPYMGDQQITALLKYHFTGGVGILAGSADGHVGLCTASGTQINLVQQMPGSGRIYCFFAESSTVSAGTDVGVYQNKGGLAPPWQQIPAIAGYRTVKSITYHPDPTGGFYFLSGGAIFLYDTGLVTAMSFKGDAITLTMGWRLFAQNTTTLFSRDFGGGTWVAIADSVRYYYPFVPGGLVMLRKNFLTDSANWRAGTLVTYDHQSYSFIGRVMQRLDALQINGNRYADVFVIRYAHELPGGVSDTLHVPYWMVYYQRNVGPIMFDKVGVGATFNRREIKTP